MKKILGFAFLILSLSACQQSQSSVTNNVSKLPVGEAPKTNFDKTIFDFGTITQGEKVQHEFMFTNIGKAPLIITSATATCGCTVPEYPKDPIKPNESGVIKVIFNSTGKIDKQDKVITITSNANPEMEKLHLVGEVLEKK